MKSAITILNLSDLHFRDPANGDCQEAFKDIRRGINNYIGQYGPGWLPDYIVVAGDIVDSGVNEERDEKYGRMRISLMKIATEFNLQPSQIVTVPGNHDRQRCVNNRENKAINEAIKDLNNTHCKKESRGMIEKIRECFRIFAEFNKPFVDSCGDNYTSYFKDGVLRYTEGVRIFEEQRLAFVTANTEWMSVSSRADNNAEFCRRSIEHLCRKLEELEDLTKYTIITVMHRPPAFMYWDSNSKYKNPLKRLLMLSDLILSGHTHSVRTPIPDMLGGICQSFNLGSPNVKLKPTEDYPSLISLMRINPIELNIELVSAEWKGTEHESPVWKFEKVGNYPLRNKHVRYKVGPGYGYLDWALSVRAKSANYEDVKRAIQIHLREGAMAHGLQIEIKAIAEAEGWGTLPEQESKTCFLIYETYRDGDEFESLEKIAGRFRKLKGKLKIEVNKDILAHKSVFIPVLVHVERGG